MSKRPFRHLIAIAGLVCLAGAVSASPAWAGFGIQPGSFSTTALGEAGTSLTQAGGHPDFKTSFRFNTKVGPDGFAVPDEEVRTTQVDLPPGLIGNTGALPRCERADFVSQACPPSTQVGTGIVYNKLGLFEPTPSERATSIYNLVPSQGQVAQFGFIVDRNLTIVTARVRTGLDYGVTATARDVPGGLKIFGADLIFWGVPALPKHDILRCAFPFDLVEGCNGFGEGDKTLPHSAGVRPTAFFTNPTSCGEEGVSRLTANSWQHPGETHEATFTMEPNTGCLDLSFDPSLAAIPTTSAAAAPSGLSVDLEVPQSSSPTGVASANLRDAVVTLPAGMAVNPASADGLQGCSPAQVALSSPDAAACPEAAKLGSVEIETPLLDHPLKGSVYLATQGTNPFQSLLAIYVAIADPETGVVIKLAGRVDPDPQTGQLTISFEENPQLPFEHLSMRLWGGSKAPLTTPSSCGNYATRAVLYSWARPAEPVTSSSTFTIDQNCGGGFAPRMQAGSTMPTAGNYSPFILRVTREDGQQNLSRIDATLPEGLLAKLAGVPLCGDAAASGNCPQATQVGTTAVGVGAGSSPLYVPQPGKAPTAVYLAGPYKGAPYSLVVKVPAQAGPFDLGTVAVRSAISVNPTSAQVSVKSDPLPQILQGIPISYRDVRVDINRSAFTLNPTSCDPMGVEGTITSSAGKSADVSARFQVANCASLGFTPKLSLNLKGGTKRGKYPALRAVLKAKPGQANIDRVSVALPHSAFLAQEHIKTICTRVQFAADACPAGSIYGHAKATTPLLDKPLSGPVYLRSSSNPLPDLVAALDGQIEIDLVGRIDSVNGGIRTTFESVPDAPVTKFVLNMKGGKKGLLVNSRNLCKGTSKAKVQIDGQNGKAADQSPVLKSSCGKKSSRRR